MLDDKNVCNKITMDFLTIFHDIAKPTYHDELNTLSRPHILHNLYLLHHYKKHTKLYYTLV